MTYYIEEFKSHLLYEKRVSNNTYENYLRDVNSFLNYKEFSAFPGTKDVELFEDHLCKIGKSKATILRVSASLRCYFNFLHKRNLIKEIPKTQKLKAEQKVPEILTFLEMEKLLSSPDSTDFKGIRDKAILETFYATGIKVSELISIKLSDINLKLGFIKLKDKDSERIIPMYPRAIKAVSDYIKFTRNFMAYFDTEETLFLNMNGSPLTRQGLWKIIKSYAEKSGIKKAITPHTIRHSFAAHLVENGAGIQDVKEIMGYSDVSSARIYSEIFKQKHLKAYNKFHPLTK